MVNTANLEESKGFSKHFNFRTSRGKLNVNFLFHLHKIITKI